MLQYSITCNNDNNNNKFEMAAKPGRMRGGSKMDGFVVFANLRNMCLLSITENDSLRKKSTKITQKFEILTREIP